MTSIEKLKIVIIEDEPDIREILQETINDCPEMEVIGTADSVESGVNKIELMKPDAVFLDIKIKGGDAFQLMSILKRNNVSTPPIILNTGYNEFEYAQRSLNEFGEDVIMILRKPFWKNWKDKEQTIIKKIFEKKELTSFSITSKTIKFKSDYTTHLLKLEDLILVESDTNSKGKGKISLRTSKGNFSIYESLSAMHRKLPNNFMRVSRFSIVNTETIENYNHLEQTLKVSDIDSRIGVGDSYKDTLLRFLQDS